MSGEINRDWRRQSRRPKSAHGTDASRHAGTPHAAYFEVQ